MIADPHKVLGVEEGAAPDIIRRAFKGAVRRYHPDVNPRNPSAAENLRAVVAAYQELERRRAGRVPNEARSGASSRRIIVACQIRGADLYGILVVDSREPRAAGDWLDIEIRALDACGICSGIGFEEIAATWWRVARFECEVCKGGGIVGVERHVRVRLPGSDTHGARLRLRGIGLPRPGQPRGDAILLLRSDARE